MHTFEHALDLSKMQGKAVTQAVQAASACVAAMIEASTSFATATAERNLAFARTLLSVKTLDAAAEIHAGFVRDSMRSASTMATKIADACAATAKECNALAAHSMATGASNAEAKNL